MENNSFYLKKLRELRKNRDLTQEEMSKILNLGSTTYKNYENNITEPNICTLIKIADFYKISLDDLLGRPTNLLNKNMLSERELSIVDKVLKMNAKQQELTEFYIDTLMSNL